MMKEKKFLEIAQECLGKPEPNWQEEFNSQFYPTWDGIFLSNKRMFQELIYKYLGIGFNCPPKNKVKIKCKDGLIQIERV